MKRSGVILALTALPSLATLPYGRQWFLWSVGPFVFYWPLLPISLAVLALSVTGFLRARRWTQLLLLVAVLVQFISLLVAILTGFPADGVPLGFTILEQAILVASEYFYLLGILLLVWDRPWRALTATLALPIQEAEEEVGTERGRMLDRSTVPEPADSTAEKRKPLL